MLPGPTVAKRTANKQTHTAAHSARAGVLRRRTTSRHPIAYSALIRVAPKNMALAPEPSSR